MTEGTTAGVAAGAVPGDHGSWLYAVARDIDPEWLDGVRGVAGGPVRPLAHRRLAAAVSPVSLAEFGEQPLARNLEDLDWLAATARAHHDVIGAIARHRPVVPLRLATVYHDDESVAGMLAARSDEFEDALARVTGRAEWGVKAYQARPPEGPEPASPQPRTATSPGAGTAYLRRRREELSESERARRAVTAAAEEVHAALAGAAVAGQQRPPQVRQLAERAEPMLLNGTYLVGEERSGEFAGLVDELAAAHPELRLELTGPWPPYSFAAVAERSP
ncbi:MAG: GvpL/GvpF family gas vesicle protein [Actinobacteria bacterium]|nr:GvpL/GvpF family gas vesicle protein [Actinomycetota bacterium]